MAVRYTHAQSEADLAAILELQRINLKTNLSEATKAQQGFLTTQHHYTELAQMAQQTPQLLAKEGDVLAGYALAMLPSMARLVPDLVPMFEVLDQIPWKGGTLADARYYMMGQVCVAESHRGQGVFEGLYQAHRAYYASRYDLLITEISTSNARSQRAHERVGFRTIHTHTDQADTWNMVVWAF